MPLEAIIIRADGALAETEDVRRKAFAHVFQEAGFDWVCDRDKFAQSQRFGMSRGRIANFVRVALKGKPETQDLSLLIDAMQRRTCKLFSEFMESSVLEPRAGVRDLVTAAHQEGVRLAVTSLMPAAATACLLKKTLGAWANTAFETITVDGTQSEDSEANQRQLYVNAANALGVDAGNCLVIEASLSGAAAAKAAGFPVITTRSAYCQANGEASVVPAYAGPVFEDLPSLVALINGGRNPSPTREDRADLIAKLQRLHAEKFESLFDAEGSNAMRVSDILKTKGADVKTIDAGATIRALAAGLKAEGVGAMVVLDRAGAVTGIISERDLARGLAEFGGELAAIKVADLMTRSVVTCKPEDCVAVVAKVMTVRRIRHVPVVVDGALVGLVSIGDVLKHRLDEVQLEANVLREFALARS